MQFRYSSNKKEWRSMFLPEFENVLNVSMNIPEEERMRSEILDTGYDPGNRTWELIIRYSIYPEAFLEQYPQVSSVKLLGNYAVMKVPENLLEELAQAPGVIYVELPKRLYFGENLRENPENTMRGGSNAERDSLQKSRENGEERRNQEIRFYAAAVDSVQASGISRLLEQLGGSLTGSGVLVGIADSGIDIFHPAFRSDDGTTRIAALWNQASREYSREEIDEILRETEGRDRGNEAERSGNRTGTVRLAGPADALRDLSGHGTAVAGIAAGSRQVIDENGLIQNRGMLEESRYTGNLTAIQGYAPEAELVVVRLAQDGTEDYVKTTRLMQAADYLVRKAGELGKPMAINFSIGNNYGSHSGRSLLSTYLSELALSERVTICVGSGNEAGKPIHVSVNLKEDRETDQSLEYSLYADQNRRNGLLVSQGQENTSLMGQNRDFDSDRKSSDRYIKWNSGNRFQEQEVIVTVAERQPSFSIQIWKKYEDIIGLRLTAPNGASYQIYYDEDLLHTGSPLRQFRAGGTQIVIYNGQPSPYQPYQEIFIDLIPENLYVDSGFWRIELLPVRIVTGEVELWLPAGATLNRGTGFTMPDADRTLTVPSTADRVISVGAIDSRTQTYASFSGRGDTAFTRQVKPDLAAPGVDVLAPRAGTLSYAGFTGTSFAAPAVTGAAALLMQWGIVEGNDPWLYGSRLKSWFHRNARQIGAFAEYPNPYVGYGVL